MRKNLYAGLNPEDVRAVLAEREKTIKAKTGIGIKVDNRVVVGGGGIIEVPVGDKKAKLTIELPEEFKLLPEEFIELPSSGCPESG